MESSIQVGVNGPAVWVKVEGKGSFLNSGNLKEFAREMLDRGYREFVIDLAHCAMMDSTFMGTMASVALRLKATLFIAGAGAKNSSLGLASIRYSTFTPMVRPPLNVRHSNVIPRMSGKGQKSRSKRKQCSRRTKLFARRRRKISFVLRTFSSI